MPTSRRRNRLGIAIPAILTLAVLLSGPLASSSAADGSLPAPATATSSGPETLDDFETGSPAWAFTGSAFSVGSASEFRNTTGAQGTAFLVSFSRTGGGAAATGTATSPEFTVDRDYLNFRLAGGSSANTFVGLTLDGGKTFVRSQSGDDTTDLKRYAWNVEQYKGQKARLVAVDNEKASAYGFIELDSVTLDERPQTDYADTLYLTGGAVHREPYATLKSFAERAVDSRISNPASVFGASPERLIELDALMTQKVITPEFDYTPDRFTVASLATKINASATELMQTEHIAPSSALGQRMVAVGISSWVRTHIVFNEALPSPNNSYETQAIYWTSATLLKQPQSFAVCAGYSRLTKDVADAAGLNSNLVLGVLRNPGNSIPPKFTHGWNEFIFSDKGGKPFYCPCDNTIGRISLQKARELNGNIHHLDCLPLYPSEWGYFLWRQRATTMDRELPISQTCMLDTLSEAEWRALVVPAPEFLSKYVEKDMPGATINVPLNVSRP